MYFSKKLEYKKFNEKKINIFFQEYECKKYNQLHGDFIDHLSTLDLIMNEGPKSKQIILSFSRVPNIVCTYYNDPPPVSAPYILFISLSDRRFAHTLPPSPL